MSSPDVLLTVEELADQWKVSQETIRRWIRKGALAAIYIGPHGLIRIKSSVAVEFMRDDSSQHGAHGTTS